MYKNHRDILGVEDTDHEPEAQDPHSGHSSFLYGVEDEEQAQLYTGKRQSALFLLKTSTVSKISDSALDNLIGDISVLLDRKIEKLRDNLSDVLHQKGVQFDDDIVSIFKDYELTSPFHGLHTEYHRKKYYGEAMNCIVSF